MYFAYTVIMLYVRKYHEYAEDFIIASDNGNGENYEKIVIG